jgi:EmrB/QacA subfamily drug resistance transporter
MTTQSKLVPFASSARWVLVSLSLSMLLSSLGTSIANVGLPTLAQEFNATFQEVQWVVLAYLLAITTLIVSVGRLGDVIGRRKLMLSGIVLFTVASILCGLASSLWLLIAARALQGLGAAVMMVLTMAMVGDAVPKAKAGSAMGLLGTMSAIGTALGPTLGGILIAGWGWPAIFLINAPLGILTFLLAYNYLPQDSGLPKSGKVRFDVMGTLMLILALSAYSLAMTMGRDSFSLTSLILLMVAIVGTGLFLLVESKAAAPLIRLAIFRNPTLSAGFAMNILITTVVMATLVVGPFYLAGALLLDAARVGLVMTSGPIVAALVGAPAGRLVDRFGAFRVSITGLVGMLLGAITMPLLPTELGIPGYIAPLVFMTAGYALFQAANNTAIMTSSTTVDRGVISGVLNLSRNLGLITGASLMGGVFALGADAINILTANPTSVVVGMRLTFAVAASLVFVALSIATASYLFAKRAAYPN